MECNRVYISNRPSPDQQHLIFASKQLEERRGECSGLTAWLLDPQHLIFAGKQRKEKGGSVQHDLP